MRVLAARFTKREDASRVLGQLRARFDLGPRDADIAPLGGADLPDRPGLVLAGRFHDDRVPVVVDLIHANGGEVLADVPEQWTAPRTPTTSTARTGPRGRHRAVEIGRTLVSR